MANAKLGTKAVGSIVKLNVNGAAKEFIVVHQGKPSSLYDESCDGTWLLMKDIFEATRWHSSDVNNLENSTIHSILNSTLLNAFESNIRDAIKQVKIPYRKNGGSSGSDQSGANGLLCKIFLLSGYEIGFTTSDNPYFPQDGPKLSYFESGTDTSANNKRIAKLNGSADYWGLRSPFTYSTSLVWLVNYDGVGETSKASNSTGIRPALILPPDMEVDSSGNVTPPPPATHKTLVNGTAYEIKGGKCLVNGTVYNILKGRTLIGGTGYDITFPESLVMPVKGDLITMNLDGTDRQYRVLKIVDGTTVEVLGMWDDINNCPFGTNTRYSISVLDTKLNTTWYDALSATAKAAIVPKNITQDYWYWATDIVYGSPHYSGFYGRTYPGTSAYIVSKDTVATPVDIGSRYVYAMSIQEVIDYLSDSNVLYQKDVMLMNANIWKAFWNKTTNPGTTSVPVLLRSIWSNEANRVWCADQSYGYLRDYYIGNGGIARPAFQIDLSKIDFIIN